MKGVYLCHFATPYKHAKHYIGYSDNIADRVLSHRLGTGARLMQVIHQAGIDFDVTRVWEGGTRTLERRLKNMGGASRICPECRKARGTK